MIDRSPSSFSLPRRNPGFGLPDVVQVRVAEAASY